MADEDDIMEFGFDDSEHIKTQGMDRFTQQKAGETVRLCIVSFNRFHDVILRAKAREKGDNLTNEEKKEILEKVDKKIAEKLGKNVSELTEVDRLDIKSPKFWNSYTHFDEKEENGGYGMGTFRCLSKWHKGQCITPEICCKKFNDPDQKVGCVIMTYPINKDGGVDLDLLKQKKYTEFFIWIQSAKKFKTVESCYAEARGEDKHVIDIKSKLDGDPKFQKQLLTVSSTCVWAKEDFDPEIREWILDQGLRGAKHISAYLGFKMSKERMVERLDKGRSAKQFENTASNNAKPQLNSGYDDML